MALLNLKNALPLALVTLLLTACGGQDTPETTGSTGQQVGARAAKQPVPQLDQPLTNADAQRAAGVVRDQPGTQHKQSASLGSGTSLSIDTSDREAVRLFFNRIYRQADVPMGWTGNYQTGDAGTVSPAFQAATIQRLNWYRAMAGLPANTTLSADYSAKDQQAALMMSVNSQLSHTPPSDWTFYTQAGAEAAGKSDLSLGGTGPDAIEQYIRDAGNNNFYVGHRRWIFYPQTRTFGSGDVPPVDMGGGKTVYGANALWVMDGNYGGTRPQVRDDFVAWPARGFMPYPVVFGRWSLSYPKADFSKAQVTVTKDGSPVAVTLEKVEDSAGEPTVVWEIAGVGPDSVHDRPAMDTRYHVVVSGVTVAQQAKTFEYDVVVFDPAVETAGAPKAQVTVPARVPAGAAYTAQATAAANASGYDLRLYRQQRLTQLSTSDYNRTTWSAAPHAPVDIIGSDAVLLYEDGNALMEPKTATLNRKLVVDQAGGAITFTRAIGNAMAGQKFHVQVSTDDGSSWADAYTETGKGIGQTPASNVRVSLSSYAGRQIQVRLSEDFTDSAYIGTGTGWTIRAIAFDGISELLDEQAFNSASGSFPMPSLQPGSYVLVPRVQYQGLYFSDGGVPAFVSVDGGALHGALSSYTLSRADGILTIRDNVGQDGVQTVQNPFRLDFTDVSLAFDVDGNAGKTYRLYRAAFNRKPDNTGVGFWINAMDGGLSLEAMAQGFAHSAEFARLYGATPTSADIVMALYKNVLHRMPDEAGAGYWLGQMATGMSVEQVLVAFSQSQENRDQVASEVQLGISFTRR